MKLLKSIHDLACDILFARTHICESGVIDTCINVILHENDFSEQSVKNAYKQPLSDTQTNYQKISSHFWMNWLTQYKYYLNKKIKTFRFTDYMSVCQFKKTVSLNYLSYRKSIVYYKTYFISFYQP